ncbi:MAG: uncharacterized protein PWQ20_1054 [Thermotogaceae bacterium]|jgi:hypothetical protein|nr:uncharacterized protein [Thermotogaceae bacterium]MDN5337984.1 uncharacterized protein [Thermotogaceae bacterium]
MIHKFKDGILFIRMDDGEDFFEKLLEVLKEHSISSAVILSGIGMLRNFEIGWFSGEKYEKEFVKFPSELLSMSGNISLKDSDIFPHIHVVLSDPNKKAFGGHLFSGTVNNTVEMFIMNLENLKLIREDRLKFTE